MSVTKLDFAEPFFSVDYVVDEESYYVDKKSIVINLAEHAQSNIYIRKVPIYPLKSSVVENITIDNIKKAIVVKDFQRCDLNDYKTIKAIKSTWKSIYACSGLERHKGLPYYKSPKFITGGDDDHMEINFCFVAEPFAPSGPHKTHTRNFDEVHAQIAGYGKMRIFEENDYSTLYRELNLCPGTVHEKMYDENGDYPWHEYMSVTPCIYCPIELDR